MNSCNITKNLQSMTKERGWKCRLWEKICRHQLRFCLSFLLIYDNYIDWDAMEERDERWDNASPKSGFGFWTSVGEMMREMVRIRIRVSFREIQIWIGYAWQASRSPLSCPVTSLRPNWDSSRAGPPFTGRGSNLEYFWPDN